MGAAQLVQVSPNCQYSVTYLGFSPTPVTCLGAYAGNDLNQFADVMAAITAAAPDTYYFGGYSEAGGSGGPFEDFSEDLTAGTLTFRNPITGPFWLALKSANQFSLYYFANYVPDPLGSIDFVMNGVSLNQQGRAQALSHATVYSTVPEPSTVIILATGLVAIGFFAWRRKEKAAA
jgi:hypothetical protein